MLPEERAIRRPPRCPPARRPPTAPPPPARRDNVGAQLGATVASDEERRRMGKILQRLHHQGLDDGASVSDSSEGEGGSDGEGEVAGMSAARARALASGALAPEDLTAAELAGFERALEAGEAGAGVDGEGWEPWWLDASAAGVELGAGGAALVEELGAPARAAGGVGAPPAPPPRPLPPLAALSARPPAPGVRLRFLDVAFAYCLALRLHAGDWRGDPPAAAAVALAASAALAVDAGAGADAASGGVGAFSRGAADAALLECVERGCAAARVPRGFAVGCLRDAAALLALGRVGGVLALMDLSRLLAAAGAGGEREARRRAAAAARRLVYLLSWANELPAEEYADLAAAAAAAYARHRATLPVPPAQPDVL
jgi:hypothetical protein